jgi:hypothetical protein
VKLPVKLHIDRKRGRSYCYANAHIQLLSYKIILVSTINIPSCHSELFSSSLSNRHIKSLDESSSPLARPTHEGKPDSEKVKNEEDPKEGSVCLGHSTATNDIVCCRVHVVIVVLVLTDLDDLPN